MAHIGSKQPTEEQVLDVSNHATKLIVKQHISLSMESKEIRMVLLAALRTRNANMDIQPCGTNEAIAFCVAKYVPKSEPFQPDGSVAQAIRE
ncbi:hypothetical protein TNCT_436301 [Trichonephila clavata]|uniref:Uncharacterized protein n=1 Tax=Trichonephila clavata TaxID=2740835 RepID=A0A8X6L5M7_TRICU|nr:hypothetical protein TNCT_436301 [Trichonephila clavata]